MRGHFTPEQVDRLLRPIKPGRVYQAQGQSHVAGWEIKAHLTRMFGFGGWDQEILSLDLVCEDGVEKGGRTGWTVTYRCVMRLTVHDPAGLPAYVCEDAATGSAQNQPQRGEAHDLALKNAITYALKRCAIGLGDQFGLSLYDKGSTTAVVGMTLVHGTGPQAEPELSVSGEDPGRPFEGSD